MLSRLSKYTRVSAGPIAIPMNSISASTPTDIPMNDLGDDDTTMFHVAVIVIERPDTIMARLVDTANSVAVFLKHQQFQRPDQTSYGTDDNWI